MNKLYDPNLNEDEVINSFRKLMYVTNDHFILKDGRNTIIYKTIDERPDDIICCTDLYLKHLYAMNHGTADLDYNENVTKQKFIELNQKDSVLHSTFCIGEGKKGKKITADHLGQLGYYLFQMQQQKSISIMVGYVYTQQCIQFLMSNVNENKSKWYRSNVFKFTSTTDLPKISELLSYFLSINIDSIQPKYPQLWNEKASYIPVSCLSFVCFFFCIFLCMRYDTVHI